MQTSRIVRCSIIQASNAVPATEPLAVQKQATIEKRLDLIRKSVGDGAQIVCLQEIFSSLYFCVEQSVKWYEATEAVPDGLTVTLMQALAKELRIAMVVPVYEVEQEGIFYNTAAVIQNDGAYLGKYRKTHIPHVAPGFWEKSTFVQAISAIRSLISVSQRSASISVMTGIFPNARAALD